MDSVSNDRTALAIERAFWSIFADNPIELITLRDVAAKAKVQLPTVEKLYPSTRSILRSIEYRQLIELEELFNSYDWGGLDFSHLYEHYNRYFQENEEVLVPLVIERRDPDFANEYRSILEDRLFKDLNIYSTRKNAHAPQMVEYIIECFVEMFLIGVHNHKFDKEDVASVCDGLMREGFEKMLRDDFGVVFKIIYRNPYQDSE